MDCIILNWDDLRVGMHVRYGNGKKVWCVARIDTFQDQAHPYRFVEIELCGLALVDRYQHWYIREDLIQEGVLTSA